MRVRAFGGLALAAALAVAGCVPVVSAVEGVGTWGWRPDPRVVHTDTAYVSGGTRIAIERFASASIAADGRGRRPAVLVLHTSAGMRGPSGAAMRCWADALARHGYVAYVVHYFDRTGDARTDDAREDAAFPEWTAALEDAVTFARRDSLVDSARVDAFGVSLGGYMALALGAADARVGRLVVVSGGLFDALAPVVRRLPPTLLLHGSADRVVPLREAEHTGELLARLRVPHSLVVYPAQGHGLDRAGRSDGLARALAFLDAPRDTRVASSAAAPGRRSARAISP